jgi:hypothetical protein
MCRNWATGDVRVVQHRKEEYRFAKRNTRNECVPAHQIVPKDPERGAELGKCLLRIFPADHGCGTELFKTSPDIQETLAQLKRISIDYDMGVLRDES